jgi:hypothetical protein
VHDTASRCRLGIKERQEQMTEQMTEQLSCACVDAKPVDVNWLLLERESYEVWEH